MGGKVEMRRLFSYVDQGPLLDQMWNTALFALVVCYMI